LIGIFRDLQDFAATHRGCGTVIGHAEPPTRWGYRVWARCTCGELLERYVTPEAARLDLIFSTLMASPN
jgi:hypothetical protein